jgi:outer membrane receptor protein involved in Fe transport
MGNLSTLLTGTALVLVIASPVAAQEAAGQVDNGAPAVEEVVVTAQKRTERLIDVPDAVTAISGDTLTAHNLTRIEDFAAHTPGLTFNQSGAGLLLTLRGLNASGQGATTAILVDDVALTSASSYQQATTPNFDTYDLERIEVLRGPQGTLYGASALGGLVKYVTRAPDLYAFGGSAQVEGDTIDGGGTGGSVHGVLNVPLINGALGLRVSGHYQRIPGFVDNPLVGDHNIDDGDRYGVRASLLWEASPAFSVRLGAIWQRDDLNGLPLVELVGAFATPATPPDKATDIAHGGRLEQNTRVPTPLTRDAQVYSATLDYDLGAATLTSISSYADSGYDQQVNDTYQSAFPGLTFGDALAPLFGQPIDIRGRNVTSVRRFNQEIRIASAGQSGAPIDYLAGVFYADEDSRLRQDFDVLSVAQPVQVLTVPVPGGGYIIPAHYGEVAGFAQLTWHLTPSIDLTGGGRYAHNWQDSQTTKIAGFVNGSPTNVTDPRTEDSDNQFTWSGALSWHPVERVNLYARVATGYRPGGPNASPPVASPVFPTRYDADTTINYELGAKGELFDHRLAFDVSVFTIDWSHIQTPSSTVDPVTGVPFNFTANGGEARSQGVEYALRWTPTPSLALAVNGAITVAKLRSDAPSVGGVSGDRLPYAPDFTNTVSLEYRVPVANAEAFAGVDWTYVGERYSDFVFGGAAAVNTSHQRLPSYNTVNLRGGVDFGRYQFDVFITNVGDERGLYSYSSGGGANGTGLGIVQQPRTIGARLSFDF